MLMTWSKKSKYMHGPEAVVNDKIDSFNHNDNSKGVAVPMFVS